MMNKLNESEKMYLVNFLTEVVNKALVGKQSVDFLVMNDCTKICWQVRDERTEGNTVTIYTIEVDLIKNPVMKIYGMKEIPEEMIEFLKEWGSHAGVVVLTPRFS